MAIKTFKEILQNKGYRINSEDRNIFEESDIQAFFGISNNDYIEFVLYDANDNQLIQKNFGLVRYIPLTNENISDYFLLAEGTVFQKYKFPSEYFIDANRLVKEAGYDIGIFKTQITLINKRLGSEKSFDKVWIQEISPSRTEIRVLPHKKGLEQYPELPQQYNAFVNDLDFRDDVIRNTFEYIEQMNPNVIGSFLKSKYSENWVQKLTQEYNLKNIDLFATQIYNKFLESLIYEFTNRISDINDLNYGKPKKNLPSITLSKNDIKNICEKLLVNTINKLLLIPNVSFGSISNEKIESIDEVQKILKTKTSDVIVDVQKKAVVQEIIHSSPPKPAVELVKEKKLKDVLIDVIKDDIIIPKEDIIPADDIGIVPKLEPGNDTIIEPKRFLSSQRDIIKNRRDEILGIDTGEIVDYGKREIVE